jgi:endonuclease YncB( thermonuclease family)
MTSRVIHNGPPSWLKKERELLKMKQPPIGITTKGTVVNVVDGDTVDVEVTRTVRVRLRDCWCPETRTRNLEEKKKGLAAKDHLVGLLEDSNDVVLFIPADSDGDIKDVFTFNRVLGYIFIDSENASSRMVADGHATVRKEKN